MKDEFDYFFEVFNDDNGGRSITRRLQVSFRSYADLASRKIESLHDCVLGLNLHDGSICAVNLTMYTGWRLYKKSRKVDADMIPPPTADPNNPLNDEDLYEDPLK